MLVHRFNKNRFLVFSCFTLLILFLGFLYLFWEDNKIGVLSVDAGPRDGETYFFMEELAEVVERNSDILRLKVVSNEENNGYKDGSFNGAIDLLTIQSNRPVLSDAALVVGLYEEAFQIITRADSNIFTVEDLKGQRMALPPHGSSELSFFWAIGDHYDIFVQNINWASMGELEAVRALLDNRVDAVFLVGSARNYTTLKLIEDFDLKKDAPRLRMIEIDQAGAMGIKRPFIEEYVIKRGTFDGSTPLPKRDIKTAAVRRLLVARSEADEELVFELTRVLFENRADLTVRFPLAAQLKAPDFASGVEVPLHAGAERYYTRNEPGFIQENAEPLALLVTVFAMMTSGFVALRRRLSAAQKNSGDFFNNEVLAIGQKVRHAHDPVVLQTCFDDIHRLLEEAVLALDKDEVTDAGFQSFAFLWSKVEKELDQKRSYCKKEAV